MAVAVVVVEAGEAAMDSNVEDQVLFISISETQDRSDRTSGGHEAAQSDFTLWQRLF